MSKKQINSLKMKERNKGRRKKRKKNRKKSMKKKKMKGNISEGKKAEKI